MAHQENLSRQLIEAARNNSVEDIERLLKMGAEVDYDKGHPLACAAYHGHRAAVEILLKAGANVSLEYGGNTPAGHARAQQYDKIAELIEQTPAADTPDEIIFHTSLSDRVLEEIFNFTSLERISLIRNGRHGPVEAVIRESFSKIENTPSLKKAFDEHVRRGGKTDARAIFPNKPCRKLP